MFRRIVELVVIASLIAASLSADCPWAGTTYLTQACNVGVGGATSAPKRLTIGSATAGAGGDLFVSGSPSARTGMLISDGTRALWLLGGASANPVLAWDDGDLVFKRGVVDATGPDSSGTEIMRLREHGRLDLYKTFPGTVHQTLALNSPMLGNGAAGDGTAILFTGNNGARSAQIAGLGEAPGTNNEQALAFFTSVGVQMFERMRINHAGKVGIGTATPASLLHLAGPNGVNHITLNTPSVQKLRIGSIQGINDWAGFMLNAEFASGGFYLDEITKPGWFLKLDNRTGSPSAAPSWHGLWLYKLPAGAGLHAGDEIALFGVTNTYTYFKENVGIGTQSPAEKLDVVGNIHATGNIAADGTIFAKYQDVAEWVPSEGDVPPATVVVIAAGLVNVVKPSSEAYDTRIAGVISAQPGLVLGEAGDTKVKVATTGRVKVKVDATRTPILAGDLLVTSMKSGMAMKSEPIDVGGVKIHRPGTVVGKALESLASGTGEILVLLSLQ